MSPTEEEMRELDELARKMPKWQKHLADFREKHPEMGPQEVMKKAGFTFRMKKGKIVHGYVRKVLKRVIDEMKDEGKW